MNLSDEASDIELLNSIGLKINEAKIILALCQIGPATARRIAQTAGLPREIVYQLMPNLKEKSLVEELIGSPKRFKAPSLKQVYAALLQQKKEENRELCKRIREASLKTRTKNLTENFAQEETSLVHAGSLEQSTISHQYKKAQKSVDLTFPAAKFLQWSQYYAEWGLKEITKRNVQMQILLEQKILKHIANGIDVFSLFKPYLKNVEFRYVDKPILPELMIFDKKRVFLAVKEEANINKMCWLFTSNPAIAELANTYFEVMWQNAAKM